MIVKIIGHGNAIRTSDNFVRRYIILTFFIFILDTDPGEPFSIRRLDLQRLMEHPAGYIAGVFLRCLKLNPAQFVHFPFLLSFSGNEKRRSEDFASLNAFSSGRNRYSIVLLVDESVVLDKPADCLAVIRRFHFLIREDTTRPTSLNGIQMPLFLILWNTLWSSFLFSRFVIGWPVSTVNLS